MTECYVYCTYVDGLFSFERTIKITHPDGMNWCVVPKEDVHPLEGDSGLVNATLISQDGEKSLIALLDLGERGRQSRFYVPTDDVVYELPSD